jgi:hypothetical protein
MGELQPYLVATRKPRINGAFTFSCVLSGTNNVYTNHGVLLLRLVLSYQVMHLFTFGVCLKKI